MAMRRIRVQGHTLNKRTADMLHRAEQRLGFPLYIMQGSYNTGVSASAGTHNGGGAVDVSAAHRPADVVKALREVGFAAWHRMPWQGPWPEHIHAIAIGDPELSSGAAQQVREYYAGQNGLASHRTDDGPRISPIPVWPVPMPPISLSRAIKQFEAGKKTKTTAVVRIQQLLNTRMEAGLKVDGIAGPKTKEAYKKWEDKVHAPVADGIPGPASLAKLVAGYYRVVK
jgi:hypothetical protein